MVVKVKPVGEEPSAISVAGPVVAQNFTSTSTGTSLADLTVTNLTAGTVNSTATGGIYNTATTTPTIGTGLAYSGTIGSLIGGVSGTLTNNGVVSLANGTGIACSNTPGGSGSCSFANQSGNTFLVNQASGNGVPTGVASSTIARTLFGVGTNGFVLAEVAGVPTWVATTTLATISGQLNLATQVTGILPVANGGTASSTLTGILVGNGTSQVGTLLIGSNLTFDGTTLSATGGGSGAAFAWTPTLNFNTNYNATNTPLWARAGLAASSTSATIPTLAISNTGGGPAAQFNGNVNVDSYFSVGGAPLFPTTNEIADFSTTTDTYGAVTIQNRSATANASADFVWANGNTVNNLAYYADCGLNSNQYTNTTYPAFQQKNNFYCYNTDGPVSIGSATSSATMGYLNFFTGGSAAANEAMRIVSSGNVGIATTSPYARLSIGTQQNGGVQFVIGSTSRSDFIVRDDTANNGGFLAVGIGTNIPASVSNNRIGVQIGDVGNAIATDFRMVNSGARGRMFVTTSSVGFGSDTNTSLMLQTNGTTRYTITNGGFHAFGTTTPWGYMSVNPNAITAGAPFFVIGSSTATQFIVDSIGEVGIGTTSPWRNLSVVGTMAVTGLTTSTAGNAVCRLATGELVDAGNTTCVTSSEKTKHDLSPITSEEAKRDIMGLVSISYTNNEDGERRLGFSAEQTYKLDPRLVELAKSDFRLPDGQVIKKGEPISIDYLRAWTVMVKFVQDISNRQDSQEARIAVLEAKIEALESQKQIMTMCQITPAYDY